VVETAEELTLLAPGVAGVNFGDAHGGGEASLSVVIGDDAVVTVVDVVGAEAAAVGGGVAAAIALGVAAVVAAGDDAVGADAAGVEAAPLAAAVVVVDDVAAAVVPAAAALEDEGLELGLESGCLRQRRPGSFVVLMAQPLIL
jgi:hypothetical protein